ncbi:MAG TPA: TetR/AcrR family transcriptional regulator [Bacillota bacterium]
MEKTGTARRLEILDAAMSLFSQKGFERTTVDEIASRAKIAKGTVYLYFKNKEHIFLSIIEKGLIDLHNLFAEINPGKDYLRQIRDFIYYNLEYVEAHREFYRLFLKERLNVKLLNEADSHRLIMKKHNDLQQILAEFLQKGINQGYLRPGNPYDYSMAILGILYYFAGYWIMWETSEPLTAKADLISELILSGIKKCS